MMIKNDHRYNVYELQGYLRELSKDGYPVRSIAQDGIMGEQTVGAVRDFQTFAELEPTGEVDALTWGTLVDECAYARGVRAPAESITPFSRRLWRGSVEKGERSDLVLIIQLMLRELLDYDYEDLAPDGIFGDETERAVLDFQRKNRLSETGTVDKDTWNALAYAYNRAITEWE